MQEVPTDNEVLPQVVLALVSVAFLLAFAMTAFLCGLCDFCKKANNNSEQKQPILGMEENGQGRGKQVGRQLSGRSTGYVETQKSRDSGSSSEDSFQSQEQRRSPYRSWSVQRAVLAFGPRRAASSDSSLPLIPGQTNVQPIQPSLRRSQSTPMPVLPGSHLPTVFEQQESKMVAESVQPDPRKLGKQSSVASASSAFGFAQEALGLTERFSRRLSKSAPPSKEIPLKQQNSAPNANASDNEEGEFVGKLQFSIKYEFTEETLVVKIFKATDLLAKDFSGTSDPFVKVMLLPNKKHKMETKVKRKKLNPVWNETFLFEGFPYNKLQERILHLEVLDYDRFSRNDPIGELNIPLADIDLTQEQTINKTLTPSSKSAGKLGKILVSLCFAPTAGRITIVIMKCEALAAKDITGKSDPYVKVWHVYQEKKIEKKKTIVKYNTLNPVFNVSFMFHVTLSKIRDTSFIISVVDKDRLSRNDTIGGIILGSKASPSETSHWAEMLNKPRTPVAQWHALKDMG